MSPSPAGALRRLRRVRQRAAMLRAPRRQGVHVYYGRDDVPGRDEVAHGGIVKFQSLQQRFPNTPRGFTVLYLGSSSMPPDEGRLVRVARRRRAAIVWNQNGVLSHEGHGRSWHEVNARMAAGLHAADHVFYQSEFCRLGADLFLGKRTAPSEVLYNPVDTTIFTPEPCAARRPTLLLGGTQYAAYRLEAALETLASLVHDGIDAKLVVTGHLPWPGAEGRASTEALAGRLGVTGRVELTGPYTQAEAPALMRRADVLLHTKYNDPCPTVVIEAMACGLPVVYSASGGVPELVGPDAGIGVPAPLDWTRDHPPAPDELAEAVLRVLERLDDHREAARRRAVERFGISGWLDRHEEVFTGLTGNR